MSTPMKCFWWIFMLIFVGGCSGYQQIGTLRHDPNDPVHHVVDNLQDGDEVRLTLQDGTLISGVLSAQSPDTLTIQLSTVPYIEHEVQIRQILRLEKNTGGTHTNGGLAFGIVVMGALSFVLFKSFQNWEIMGQ